VKSLSLRTIFPKIVKLKKYLELYELQESMKVMLSIGKSRKLQSHHGITKK